MEGPADGHGIHLQPETILCALTETEETIWGQGGITDDSDDHSLADESDLGNLIFQQGRLTKQIHNYFTNLEQRKCCLLLAGCKQTFRSVRLVRSDGRDSGIEEGAMMKSSKGNTETVSCLNAEDFQVFQQALRCAAFPVLGAPDPPSGSSPSPRTTPSTGVKQKRPDIVMNSAVVARAVTPHSAGDSGVEEQDDAMVPAETLCELLRRAFRLTTEKFTQYEDIVASQLEKKSPQKTLVEELVRQLVALENNSNTFYNPTTFLNRLGYDQWQQRERTHITELIQKFWHFSLPQPTQSSSRSSYPKHEQYTSLMEKLIQYEFPYRQENEIDLMSAPPTSTLSSASVRLLKEFGLRYGVGDQYRRIVYLHYLAHNFEPTLWFIQHVSTSLMNVMEGMPSKRSFLIIVKEEYSMLEKSLLLLDLKASAALGKMKTLFPSNQPSDGIESLIELLSITLQSRSYLLMQSEERLAVKLQKIVQNIFPTTYERHKLVAKDELRQSKWDVELTPRLLNMLIGHIRDEVNDYKMNYQHTFLRYFNITLEAAQEFYKLLMSDLQELHRQTQDDLNSMEIDLLMLSLAYRLNQLDKDWTSYITPQMQTWRNSLLQEAQHWTIVMKVKMQSIVTEAVGQDRYESHGLSWIGSLHQSTAQGSSQRVHSASFKSLTPSLNSAFSMLSSPYSTPGPKNISLSHPPVIQESSETYKQDLSTKENMLQILDNSIHTINEKLMQEERRPNSDPVNISHSAVLNDKYIGDMARSLGHYEDGHYLSFAHLRHSSSLPSLQNLNKESLERSGKHKDESNLETDADLEKKHVDIQEVVANESSDKNNIEKIEVDSRKNNENKVTLLTDENSLNDDMNDTFGSPEIEILMESPIIVPTELDDSDDSSTLTDDSVSPTGEFKFPPLEEVNSVSASPVCSAPCEPVMIADTFTSKMSITRPRPEPARPTTVKDRNTGKMTFVTKASNVSSAADKSITQGNQPRHSLTTDSIKTIDNSGAKQDTNVKESFTDSLISTISFPSPQKHSSATLPVSSSAIDLIVIIQRLVGIGKTLCQTFCPLRRTNSSDLSTPPTSYEEEIHYQPISYNCRQKLYDAFLNCLCSTVCVFADNMLCMDLCGTSSSTAHKLAGPKLVEYLQTQQRSGLIWGCRHNSQGNKSCFEYMNKKTDLLCDRHEPITRDMCTRINNIMAALTFLEVYHRRLGNMFAVYGDWSVRQKVDCMSVNSMDMVKSDFIVLENYGYDPSGDRMDVFETVSQKCSVSEGNVNSRSTVLVSSPIDSYKNHLLALLRAQSRIMAYRLNLFVCDALPVLLALKAPNVSLEKGLKPITEFLTSYITQLRNWLYIDCFRRVLECLWIFIVQDFELELCKLERLEASTESMGQLLLQAIAHLLKFMNSQHESLRKELLLEQADEVSFRLSLYAMPVLHLIPIYKGLVKENFEMEDTSYDTQYQSVLHVKDRLRHDLQKLKKGFSGNELVRWILDNQGLFTNLDPVLSDTSMRFTPETAYHVAQRLLDWGLIADVEGESVRGSSPTFSMSFEFPDVTQLPGFSYPERAFSRQSDDSTPQATPRATPRPSLRDSIRAASRHSLVKLSTPGLSKFDKNTSIRSLRGSKYDRNERVGRKKENSESSKDASTDDNLDAYNDQAVVEIHSHYHKPVAEIPVIIESPRDTGSGTEKLTSLHDRNGIKVENPRDTGSGTEKLTSLHDRTGMKVESPRDTGSGTEKLTSLHDRNGIKVESPRDTGSGTEKLTSLHDRTCIKVESPRDTGSGTEQLTSLRDRSCIKVETAGNITKNDDSEEVRQGNSDRSIQRRDIDKVVREVDIAHNSSLCTKSKSDHVNPGHSSVPTQDNSDVDKPIINSSCISDSSNNGSSAINNNPFQFENLETKSSSTDSISPAINPGTIFTNEHGHPHKTSTSNPDFDPYLPHGTPVSFSSGVSCSSHSILFMGTSEHFYYVCPQVGNELETTLKNYEQFQLVEECYQRKILPEYILRIINSRRVNDVNARNFVRNLPYDLIQKMNADDSTAGMCVSS